MAVAEGRVLGFSLEEIAENLIANSLALADKSLSSSVFYTSLLDIVSEETGLSKESVKRIHHAFHWGLVLSDYAPLYLLGPTKVGDEPRVCLKPEDVLESIEFYRDKILDKHGEYISERLEKALS